MPNFEDIKKIMSKVKAGFVKARKLTEEGYYRSAFGELGDILEVI